jgi:hypothetical protein
MSHDPRTFTPMMQPTPSSDEHPDDTHLQTRRTPAMQSLDIQGFSYEERQGLLPALTSAFTDCGGWVVGRKTISPSTMEFRLEIQLRSVVDLYASIVSSGLELTRSGHLSLTDLCTCRKNLSAAADLGQVVSVRLEISFLEDVTLHSLLMAGNTSPDASSYRPSGTTVGRWNRLSESPITSRPGCHRP